ncbi:c-type cytochrome [Thiorhodococcus minor]|nr:c-type cytochrome [Thiorhodococcus minor]
MSSTLLAVGLTLSSAAAAEGVRSASMLANTCAGCHSTHGASAGEQMPTIGGMDNGYLYDVLRDYKTGVRGSTIMGRIMRGYTDREIHAIAAYFAAQPWVSTDRVAVATDLHIARDIHARQCETCHEDGGREQEDKSPRLAGQWAGYLEYALEACREIGHRCRPRKMGERVMELSDAEIAALARFYESEK